MLRDRRLASEFFRLYTAKCAASGSRPLSAITEESLTGDGDSEDALSINLNGTPLGPKDLPVLFSTIKDCDLVWNLSISKVSLPENSLIDISSLLTSVQLLTSLTLEDCQIQEAAGLSLCRSLAADVPLMHLNLSNNQLSNNFAVSLSEALAINHHLTDVVLSKNKIGDRGGVALATALQRNTTVKSLSLANNPVGFKTAQSLLQMLTGNTVLSQLDVLYTNIGASQREALEFAVRSNVRTHEIGQSFNVDDTIDFEEEDGGPALHPSDLVDSQAPSSPELTPQVGSASFQDLAEFRFQESSFSQQGDPSFTSSLGRGFGLEGDEPAGARDTYFEAAPGDAQSSISSMPFRSQVSGISPRMQDPLVEDDQQQSPRLPPAPAILPPVPPKPASVGPPPQTRPPQPPPPLRAPAPADDYTPPSAQWDRSQTTELLNEANMMFDQTSPRTLSISSFRSGTTAQPQQPGGTSTQLPKSESASMMAGGPSGKENMGVKWRTQHAWMVAKCRRVVGNLPGQLASCSQVVEVVQVLHQCMQRMNSYASVVAQAEERIESHRVANASANEKIRTLTSDRNKLESNLKGKEDEELRLRGRVSELEQKLARAEESLRDLQNAPTVVSLREELQSVRNTSAADKSYMSRQIEELGQLLDLSNTQLERVTAQMEHNVSTTRKATKENEELRQKLKLADAENAENRKKIASLQQRLQQNTANVQRREKEASSAVDRVANLQRTLESREYELDELIAAQEQAKERLAMAEEEVRVWQSKAEEAISDREEMDSLVSRAVSELDESTKALSKSEAERTQQAAVVLELTTRADHLTERLKAKEAECAQQENMIEERDRQLKSFMGANEELLRIRTELQTRREALQSEVATNNKLMADIRDMREELQRSMAENTKLKSALADATAQHQETTRRLDDMMRKHGEVAGSFKDYNERIIKLQEDLMAAQERASNLDRQIREGQAEMTRLTSENAKLNQSMEEIAHQNTELQSMLNISTQCLESLEKERNDFSQKTDEAIRNLTTELFTKNRELEEVKTALVSKLTSSGLFKKK